MVANMLYMVAANSAEALQPEPLKFFLPTTGERMLGSVWVHIKVAWRYVLLPSSFILLAKRKNAEENNKHLRLVQQNESLHVTQTPFISSAVAYPKRDSKSV